MIQKSRATNGQTGPLSTYGVAFTGLKITKPLTEIDTEYFRSRFHTTRNLIPKTYFDFRIVPFQARFFGVVLRYPRIKHGRH